MTAYFLQRLVACDLTSFTAYAQHLVARTGILRAGVRPYRWSYPTGTGRQTMTDSAATSKQGGFTAEELAAMKERSKETRSATRRGKVTKDDGTRDVLDKIAEMEAHDRSIAERVHALVTETAPDLWPKVWYGQPAYAKAGTIVCFFQAASKFNTRYATLGFTDTAQLDDGSLWPTAFAIRELTPAGEDRIRELVARAAR
jgi:uncharacterized protein YdhG (YjbR/CyaY superfamily)